MTVVESRPGLGAYKLQNPDLLRALPQEVLDLDDRRKKIYQSLNNLASQAAELDPRDEMQRAREPVFMSTVQSDDLPIKLREILLLAGADFNGYDHVHVNYYYIDRARIGKSRVPVQKFELIWNDDNRKLDSKKVYEIEIYLQPETLNSSNSPIEWQAFDVANVPIRAYTPGYDASKTEIEVTERVGLLHRILSDRRHEGYQLELLQELVDIVLLRI